RRDDDAADELAADHRRDDALRRAVPARGAGRPARHRVRLPRRRRRAARTTDSRPATADEGAGARAGRRGVRRRIAAAGALAAVVAVAAGCGGNSTAAPKEDPGQVMKAVVRHELSGEQALAYR